MKPPCKGCEKRQLGCRTECVPWQQFEEHKKQVYEERRARIESAVEFKDYELLARRGRWQRSNQKRKLKG